MNKAIFTGNLTRDPETKVMSNGKPRTVFTLAVTRSYANAQGQYDADFIQITCYDKRAEIAEKHLSKGRKVLVETHVKTGSYEKDGKRVYTTEFVADKIEFLSAAPSAAATAATTESDHGYAETDAGYGGFTEVSDEELPF